MWIFPNGRHASWKRLSLQAIKSQLQEKNLNIPTYELKHDNEEVAFAIRFTEDMVAQFGDKPDVPHRHNYYTVLWSHNHSGKHIVDYKEFDMKPNDVFFINN